MKQKITQKNRFNPDKLRLVFIVYMVVLYFIDLISTYLAMQGGGYENNPAVKFLLSSSGSSGYLMVYMFFLSLILIFYCMAEIVCYFLSKSYDPEVVYVACYISILSMFTVIQITNIIGNLFIYFL